MDENAYTPPAIPSDRPPAENPFHNPRNRVLIAAVILIPILAYLAFVVLYIAEEARYQAAEKERVTRVRSEDAQPTSPTP